MFDKGSSFARLFPNQDFLSGKGFGNLIALPFFKPADESGNSCFIHPESFDPYPDQWQFLHEIKRVPTEALEGLYQELSSSAKNPTRESNGKLIILLRQNIRIRRDMLTPC